MEALRQDAGHNRTCHEKGMALIVARRFGPASNRGPIQAQGEHSPICDAPAPRLCDLETTRNGIAVTVLSENPAATLQRGDGLVQRGAGVPPCTRR